MSLDPLATNDVTADYSDDDVTPPNVVLQKDIEHLERLEGTSGAAKVILEGLKKEAAKPTPLLDVISASRTPSASKEPHYKTRYESHVFACELRTHVHVHATSGSDRRALIDSVSVSAPSRGLDRQPNRYAVDDQMLGRKYRGVLQSIGNYPGSSLTLNQPHFLSA